MRSDPLGVVVVSEQLHVMRPVMPRAVAGCDRTCDGRWCPNSCGWHARREGGTHASTAATRKRPAVDGVVVVWHDENKTGPSWAGTSASAQHAQSMDVRRDLTDQRGGRGRPRRGIGDGDGIGCKCDVVGIMMRLDVVFLGDRDGGWTSEHTQQQ